MAGYPAVIENLFERLIKFPGIGRRSAERIVFYLLEASQEEINLLSQDILKLKSHIHFCRICNNLGESDICSICRDTTRQRDVLCIVETPKDVGVIERTGGFKGVYHVLLGAIAPLEGKAPSDLKINGLIKRIKDDNIKEVIIATDSDTEGETTALYLTKLIKPSGVKVSRIGFGIPVGSNIEYSDSLTLARALESRREI
ncbi:MAG: recombination mediator RecR [Candidatus Omnitrophica bacterium]|nr:recombination mediator RecR [Candidatus Omnitrophota bacterium]MDD5352843.1 recombination mediator RecR [Candidatus Omnitrophota bacterium]MDD5550442.1 recombination mediator RecR [Candidatus Omnitrophota bacterium]